MKIKKCQTNTCPLREHCYRWENGTVRKFHTVHYSSYFIEAPYDKKKGTCEYYWGDKKNELLVSLADIFNLNGKGKR